MPEQLTEHLTDWQTGVVIEREARVIRNAALAGVESRNGYRYSETSLRQAVPLYENAPVFLDHPASARRPRDRSARDLAGSVVNVRFEAGRLRGDLRELETEAGNTLLALAAAEGPGVGMSHVVLAERSSDGATVERIVEVISVDAVAFPATTRTFRESQSVDAAGSAETASDSGNKPAPAEPFDRAERPASSSAIELSASAELSMPGSLERLLASVDAELPGHLDRLAAAPRSPSRGRGVRVGLFPSHLLVECPAADVSTRRFALAWRCEGDRLLLGDELIPLEEVEGRLRPWTELLTPPPEEPHAPLEERLEQIERRLGKIAADRGTTFVEGTRPATSTARRTTTPQRVADDVLVRAIRRR